MTDVIEDVEHLLERAIRCLTLILHDLLQRLNQNKHRPLSRRNLVRWIATFLPSPKDPRIRLQPSLGEAPSSTALQRWASSGSLASAFSTTSLQHLVEEDLGDNLIHFRVATSGDDEDDQSVFREDFHPISERSNRFTSTPNFDVSTCSSAISSDPQGGKLADMEAELASLRKQIAMLVMAQESSLVANKAEVEEDEECESETLNASFAAAIPLPCSPALCSTLNDSGCESSEGIPSAPPPQRLSVDPTSPIACKAVRDEPIVCAVPVPPAPPPPPPLPPISCSSGISVAELVKKRKMMNSQHSTLQSSGRVPDMADVLKGLGSVKLRSVERSPGGTPMCRRKLERTPTDPASIIALALKKKFASHRGLSPESDQENDASSFLSDKTASPFGQHMLRKTQRRLSLFNESDDWTPVSSPLKPVNI